MALQTHLVKRNGTYYFRRRIPEDLLQFYHPKTEIVYSLRTKDKREAERLVRIESVRIDKEFDLKRHLQSGTPIQDISESEANRLATLWSVEILRDDEDSRLTNGWLLGRDANLEGIEAAWMDWTDRLRDTYASGKPAQQFEPMDKFLASMGIKAQQGSPSYNRLAYSFLEAGINALSMIRERNKGVRVPTPAVGLGAIQNEGAGLGEGQDSLMLSKVVQHFLDNYPDKEKPMYKKHTAVLPMFLDWVGDKPVGQLRQLDLEDYLRGLCKLPPRWADVCRQRGISPKELAQEDHPRVMAPKTYEDTYQASLRPFLKASIRTFGDAGFPHRLTTEGVAYTGNRKPDEDKQRAMTSEEIKRLFQGKEYQEFAKDRTQAHKYWLPLIGLYTGARVNEVCQINPQTDVIKDHDSGIWYFNLTAEGETAEGVKKTIKNKVSVRQVPIHAKLIELGFLKYVQRIKDSGALLLFPSFEPIKGKASGEAEKWFRKLLEEVGLRDETPGARLVGFHCFRHTIENYALNHDLNLDKIVGHAGIESEVKRGYQGKLWLSKAKALMDRVVFDVEPPRIKA